MKRPHFTFSNTLTDQEDVARKVARYNLLAIPVVNGYGKMVGIVTVDDVIHIIKDKATEDMFKMAGAIGADDNMVTGGIFSNVRVRWPWLLASWFGGMCSFYVTTRCDPLAPGATLFRNDSPFEEGMQPNVSKGAGFKSISRPKICLTLRCYFFL